MDLEAGKAKTMGWVLLASFVVVFIIVLSGVAEEEDYQAFLAINVTWSSTYLNPIFIVISRYGRSYFWIPVVLLSWILGGEKYKRASLMMALTFIFIIAVGLSIKAFYYRPRPFLTIREARVLLPKPTGSSFPSGHALIVFGGATVALLYFKRKYSLPLLVEALLVAYSRMYVGLHYPTDVVAGALLGSSIGLLSYAYLNDKAYFDYLYRSMMSIYCGLISLFRGKKGNR